MSNRDEWQQVHDNNPQAVLAIDFTGTIVYANPKAISDYFADKHFSAQTIRKFFPHTTGGLFSAGEHVLTTQPGEQRNVLVAVTEQADTGGKKINWLFLTDITALKKKENLLAFLNAATGELSRARDTKSALDKIAKLIVPKFAGWFSIDLLEDGKLVEMVLVHEDPGMIEWARRYRELYPTNINDNSATSRVLRTGEPNCVPVITPEMIAGAITDPQQLALVTRMNLQSVITVAVYAGEKITGIINFVSTEPGMHYDQADTRFAQSFANHAGMVLENARLNEAAAAEINNEKIFRFLADTVPHKIWTSGPDGKANYYNQGWYDYAGVNGLAELKSIVWDMLHPEDRAIAAVEFPKVIETGAPMETEQRLRRCDGEYRWHLTRLSPHRDEAGTIRMWIGTCTDIHEQKAMAERKDEFLGVASHELKTPLTSIKAYNQLMAAMPQGLPVEEFIQKSAKSIYRLERLINDLLDVTKINAGAIGYVSKPFNFKEMLQDSIGNLKYNLTHQIVLENAADIEFTGDQIRLEQVMNNLLSNAIKYSPEANRVVVNMIVEKPNIVVSVRDFGIGIAPENLDKLFNRYYRVSSKIMHFEGLGLGLYISSEILRHHRGSFWIESEPGKGSTFFFRLPLKTMDQPAAPIAREDYYRDEHLEITVNKKDRRIEVDWTGFQDLASVKHGCLLMLEYLKRHPTDRIINDNRNVSGTWSEAAEWVGNIWFPLMEKAGLRYFAHIPAVNIFGQLSAKKSIDIMAGIITTQYFTDYNAAREWIESF